MFSFGFQQAYQRGLGQGDHVFFNKVCAVSPWIDLPDHLSIQCLDAAKSVIENMIESLAPSGYMRYAPDGE